MKKYTLKVSFFIVGFLLFTFLLKEVIFFSVGKINIGDYGVLNRIVNGQINTDILLLGSSRGYVGMNPSVIKEITGYNSYNISQNGKRFGVQLPLLKTYLKYNKKPKIIIQEIGCYSVGLETGINDIHKYLPYFNEDILYNGLSEVEKSLWLQKYLPFTNFYYLHADFQKRILKDFYLSLKKGKDYLIHGYFPNNTKWTINESEFYSELKEGYISPIDEKPLQRLNELVTLCKLNKIKLMLVYLPDYSKFPSLQKNRPEIIELFNKIAEKNSIEFIEYKDLELSKDRSNFYNFRHLSPKGANKFSEILAYDLKKLLIEENYVSDNHK